MLRDDALRRIPNIGKYFSADAEKAPMFQDLLIASAAEFYLEAMPERFIPVPSRLELDEKRTQNVTNVANMLGRGFDAMAFDDEIRHNMRIAPDVESFREQYAKAREKLGPLEREDYADLETRKASKRLHDVNYSLPAAMELVDAVRANSPVKTVVFQQLWEVMMHQYKCALTLTAMGDMDRINHTLLPKAFGGAGKSESLTLHTVNLLMLCEEQLAMYDPMIAGLKELRTALAISERGEGRQQA